ncbi:serine/threonine-protein kinase PknD [[Mycobacterium] crassicus]|uniref:non-specific serine/threonine protein kinase n=1 Tax=[Mycobacterium] crassicus TaxID=2872309 RepID=A0ABU5XCG7_9MYCO|nr:serine/threonine-protein kinase PknD [Mycolicibacter sp. MYC098]MEB3019503.1 serine/threonine-protein kinase PknD [Mycolicibacter sp. MYC098]
MSLGEGSVVDSREADSRAGTQFGHYRLLRLLGRGGMGEVYVAEDTRKNRSVALKLITPGLSGNELFRNRMRREANAAGQIADPHVVPIYDYGEIDGQMFVEMQLIQGDDLAAVLRRYGPLNPARAVAIIEQVAAALDAAHGNGVTHRDVKPENILITRNDFAYLVDFGIARAATDPGLTQTGTTVGTYNYMAPERFSADEVTYRSDIYSLACVLSECLVGVPPYRATSVEQLIAAHLMGSPPRPSQLRPGSVPIALDQVVARGMARNPWDRYSSAGDLAHAAHDALTVAEQHRAALIVRQGANSDRPVSVVGAASGGGSEWASGVYPGGNGQPGEFDGTMARPVSVDDRSRAQSAQGVPNPPFANPLPAPTASRGSRRKWLLPAAAAALVLAVAGAAGGYAITHKSGAGAGAASGQSIVPLDGLTFRLSPGGLALDSGDNLYITNQSMYGRVLKLAPGSSEPEVLPFSGLYEPQGVAVANDGSVYVTDFNNRVVKLAADSGEQTELPFTGLNYPEGLVLDAQGSVYVADRGNNRVVKLPAGSDQPVVLPFTGLRNPDDVAVDSAGNVYVTDTDNDRVVRLSVGSDTQTDLPFTGLSSPWGVTVDRDDNVYVTNHESHKVMKLEAGTTNQTKLPFTGLNTPLQVVVGGDGVLYVADRGNNRVVKLTADS